MKMSDSEAKKRWDKKYVVFVGFKLFRTVGKDKNDQDIIDYLDGKVKGEIIKLALREYMENHKEENK